MTHDLAITGGRVVTPQGILQANIGITAGRVAVLTPDAVDAHEVRGAPGRVVLPGAVDIHVHFNEPGRPHWEGWGPGSRAAAAGGVTTVVEMPLNSIPSTTTADALKSKVASAQGQSLVDFALWGGLVADNLDDLPGLARGGVVGFKAFMCESGTKEFAFVDDAMLHEGLARLAELGQFLAVHAESNWITHRLTEQLRGAGRRDRPAWGESRPPAAELEAIQRALFLADKTGCRLHIVHMSLPDGTQMIQAARDAGQRVTVETCAHSKCAPPLRNEKTQEELWRDVLGGRIDCITSDHSPCPTEDKTKGDEDIFEAWGGITGVQTLVPLMLTEGVHRRGMPLEQFATLLSVNPAKIVGLWPQKGAIQIGADADLLLIDIDREWTVERDWLQSRHRHSPFIGRRVRGWIEHVMRRGETIVSQGEAISTAGGRWLTRQ
ncbi:MAG: allantoinase AllB [Armatimonadetes bacterium]|nr:allantoinase AllB [Armatimonadota bacterium]